MQNKPNFSNTQMNINPVMTKHYGIFHFLERRKNKAKTNPIKPNFKLFAGDVIRRNLCFLNA